MAQDLIEKIRAAAQAKGIDPEVAINIARAESGFDPSAKAKTSTASGLFQILNKTWSGNKGAPGKQFDADENIRVGTDIIAQNTDSLKKFLGRSPSAAEVYAAHYFGATGARGLLTASPDTPTKQLFSEEVLAANPNLKNKTAAQVMSQLEGKMKPASNVSRETKQAKAEPTPAEEMMTRALPAGTTAQAMPKDNLKVDIKSMPASYQAAFALAALADAQDEEDDKAFNENKPTEAEQFFASYKPVNHLASLDLSVAPVNFAEGGEATARQDEPMFDAASRTFVDVMTGRRTPITEKDFTAREQLAMLDAVKRSQARGGKGRVDYQDYPSGDQIGPGYVDIRNTLGGFQYKQMPDGSTVISDRYDFHGPRVAEYEKMGTGEKLVKSAANALSEFVKSGGGVRDAAGELGRAWIGSKGPEVNIRIPVKRADGSPEEGERLTPQQIERLAMESNTPAFIAQKSGIGRKQGNISKAIQSGAAHQAIGEGIKDVPYDLAGIPVDITTMVMRPFGYKNEKPFLGSDYLKEFATEKGFRKPMTDDPTLKGFHYLGEFGAGMAAPGKIIEGARALKGAAADALAGFKAGYKSERPGMTDMMTGQRVEAPEITPEMATEFSQWRQQTQNQLRNQNAAPAQDEQAITNAIFDNLAGVNQQQIAADVAAGRLPASVAPVPALLRAEQNIARLPADAQEQLRLFEEAAAAPARARPVAITQPPTQLPPPPPYVAPPVQVSAEFPFVGRLDEFAASMKGPAQKEQLINQVKGKFREHDVARLEEALSQFGAKDKITPAALQEALANTYSPSRFRSADVPAGQGGMYNVHDNIFQGNKNIAGAMNLYLKETPETQALYEGAAAVKKAADKALYGRKPEDITIAVEALRNNPLMDKIPDLGVLADRMESALPAYSRFAAMQKDLDHAGNMVVYPILYRENGFDFYKEIDRRVAPLLEGMTPQQRSQALFPTRRQEELKLIEELMQKGSDRLVAMGGDPVDVVGFMQRHADSPSPNLAGGSDKILQDQLKDISTPIQEGINAALGRVRENIHTAYDKAYEQVLPYTGYKGQHEGVTNREINPIGFSRYTEHTVDMGGKQLNGRHVHELQSDLAQDVRELGHKGKSMEKDREELAALKAKFDATDELDPTQKIERAKLDKRIDTLERRISLTAPGKYSLEQPFAGFETSPAVEMQLLMKNAIQSTMRAGQDFVTFPGKESAKPSLYEKVLPNLKQVVKDLGGEKAGFDIKPITLPNPGKNEPTVWGVVWSPETAAKVLEKGIPFKKGGMVERKNDDNRRYL